MNFSLLVNEKPVQAELALPAGGSGPGVLVLHAWWGLKPFFRDLCARLAEEGFVALAPDLNNGEIAQTIPEAERLMEHRDFQFTGDIIMTALHALLSHPACTSRKVGVIGFSMGAAWALVASEYAAEQAAAAVLFYGGGDADFSKVRAKVQGHFSDADEWEPLEPIQGMQRAMQTAGVDVTLYVYPGQAHWFMESDRPEYDPAAAQVAWERAMQFLKNTLVVE